tara:strand:+ start:125 stop:445 length:321 start_codon:yes stop_codon:yes gene_type:complete
MKNTKYITQLLESKGLTVTVTEEVLGKDGYQAEVNGSDQKVGQWVGIEGISKNRQVNVVIYQDIAKGKDKVESAYMTKLNHQYGEINEIVGLGKGSYPLSDLEFLL